MFQLGALGAPGAAVGSPPLPALPLEDGPPASAVPPWLPCLPWLPWLPLEPPLPGDPPDCDDGEPCDPDEDGLPEPPPLGDELPPELDGDEVDGGIPDGIVGIEALHATSDATEVASARCRTNVSRCIVLSILCAPPPGRARLP